MVLVTGLAAMPVLVNAQSRPAMDESTMCPMHYAPVCGLKDEMFKTYGNRCLLDADKASFAGNGECNESSLEDLRPAPEPYTPPANCVAWNDGCNTCARQPNGLAACTLMACTGEPRAGFCTRYAGEGEDTPRQASPGSAASSPMNPAPEPAGPDAADATLPAATTTPEAQPNFFVRVWTNIASWLGNLF